MHLSGHAVVHPAFKRIWKSSCQSKHKVFQLADAKRQIKHQRALKKEKYGASGLQLCLMQWADRGISVSSFHPLSFCNFLLELVVGSNRSADGFSSEYRVVQKAAPSAFLHRDHNNHVLDNLEDKKWTYFQPNSTFNSSIQERVQR